VVRHEPIGSGPKAGYGRKRVGGPLAILLQETPRIAEDTGALKKSDLIRAPGPP
jgi:hypothetical protein